MAKRCFPWVLALLVALSACRQAAIPAATRPPPTDTPAPTAAPTEPPTAVPPLPAPTAAVAPTARQPTRDYRRSACPFRAPSGMTAECGMVTVPADHADPDGATLRLAVAIFHPEVEEPPPDPVFLLAGGPGESVMGSADAVALMLSPILSGRDLVLYDQRGAGLSQPALECPEVVAARFDSLDQADSDAALQAGYDAWMDCRDRLLAEGHDLTLYTATQSSADVESLRVALGYDQINLYGGSYGSYLAQAVMRDHAEHLRSAVLESVWPLPVSFGLESLRTVPAAILDLLQACEDDPDCDAAYPDLTNVLYQSIDRLNADPVATTLTNPLDGHSYPALLNGDALLGSLQIVLYQTPAMPSVPKAIYDVYHGDYTLLTQLATLLLAHLDLLSEGMELSVLCAEDFVGLTRDDLLAAVGEAPRGLRGSASLEAQIDLGQWGLCQAWPSAEEPAAVKQALQSDIPTLLLTGEFDPVTPPAFARAVAEGLSQSFLYEFPGTGHVGESTHKCALQITADFLNDPTTEPDASCAGEMEGVIFRLPGQAQVPALEPYENSQMGIAGLAPVGWGELQPGLFARGLPIVDMAILQYAVQPMSAAQLLAGIASNLGSGDMPAPEGMRQGKGLTWTLYAFEAGGGHYDLALAEARGQAYLILLLVEPGEREAFFEGLFLPALEAFEVTG